MALRIGLAVSAVVAIGILAVALLLGSAVVAAPAQSSGVTIECSGPTRASPDVCREWGDEVLAAGPPSSTFEMDDVVRLRLDRPMLGFASTCRAEYFLSRYPDDVAWAESVSCR